MSATRPERIESSARIAAAPTPKVIRGSDPVSAPSARAATIDIAKFTIASRAPTANTR